MILSNRRRVFRAHFTFWSAFITYEAVVGYSFSGHLSPLLDYLIFYALNIGLFYIHGQLVYRSFTPGKRGVLLLVFGIAVELVGYLIIKKGLIFLLVVIGHYEHPPNESVEVYVRNSIWRAIYFMGLGTAFAFVRSTFDSRKRITDLDKERLEQELKQERLQGQLLSSENDYLKAQIDPHFIFNTLNFLYNEVATVSEETADTVLSFADVIRYAITAPGTDGKVALVDEIEHVNNYILLNAKRFNGEHHLLFNVDVKPKGKEIRIIPLLLITVIENVYKHADLANVHDPAKIDLNYQNERLILSLKNRKADRVHHRSSGLGIDNVVKRLAATYPNAYELNIQQDDRYYQFELQIELRP